MSIQSVNKKELFSRLGLYNTFRKLWEQHIMWTRSFIVSTAAGLGDLAPVTRRLLRNPVDFGRVLQVFYCRDIVKKFVELFTEHLTIATKFVNAAKAGNTAAVNRLRDEWYRNAKDIARFLSKINPNWNFGTWESMLNKHLRLTEQEAVLRLNGQFEEDIAIYDKIEDQALEMADYMAEGILKQFSL
ncbi:MAG: acetylglutamate kinase [Clostridiales bacterium]|nr:acetylglutamate kinase [Clostridiales bacterium]